MNTKNNTFKKFLSYYKPYRKTLTLLLIIALMATGVTLLIPLVTRYITKDLLEQNSYSLNKLLISGAVMLILVIVQTIVNSIVDYRGHVMGAKMERDIRQQLYDHYQELSFGFFDDHRVGELMSRLTNDVNNLAEMYHHVPEDIVTYFARFIGAFIILFNINEKLTLIVFAIIPPMLVFVLFFSAKMRKACDNSYKRIGEVNSFAEDTLSGIRVVKSFGNEELEKKRFQKINENFFFSRKSIYGNESVVYQGCEFFMGIAPVIIVVFGGIGISGGSLDLSDLITFLLYVGYVTVPIQHLMQLIGQFQSGYSGFKRFNEMMEIKPSVCEKMGAEEAGELKGDIEFKDVSFGYGHEAILENVDLTIHFGEYVAIVGHSGVGKTTLCSLIPRFYDVNSGEILIDGKDIRSYTLDSLRKNIGTVEQSIYLFAGTIGENISYGLPRATKEQIAEAAKKAGAHDFISKLPMGYDTYIGERGVKLSGGQKQRISIARVFLKNPSILIFDEATSSLDNESEGIIAQSLEDLSKNRTTIVIAHRLSTIKNAQRIIVIDDKGISEIGTHSELIEHDGIYAKLYNTNI